MKRFQSVSMSFLPILCIILTALLSRVDAASADEGDRRPNIIFILADDLGMYTLPAYGGNEFETPNLDRLCKSGMLLSHCHSRAMCAATRRVLLSGRSFAQRSQPLNLPQVMKQNGYDVGFVGKWMQDEMPWNHGFEEGLVQVNWYKHWGPSFVVFNSGGYLQEHNLKYPLPTDMKDHGLPFEGPHAKAFKLRDEYGPRVLNRFALDYVERHKDNPFFLYYPMKLPHWPTMPTPDTPMGAREEAAVEAMKQWGVDNEDAHKIGASRDFNSDVVAYIDKMVGNVVSKLEELGIRRNTLLVFTSDNGPGTDGNVREDIQRVPGRKGGMLEGSTRAPCFLSWPNVIKSGSSYDGLVDFTDFLPTFVEVSGSTFEHSRDYHGVSFFPQLCGETAQPRQHIYFHDGWHPGPTKRELIQGYSGDWWDRDGHPPRVNYPISDFGALRYVLGNRYKLYSDGRFCDLKTDLHERSPIEPRTGEASAEKERERLQAVLDSYPAKKGESQHKYRYDSKATHSEHQVP